MKGYITQSTADGFRECMLIVDGATVRGYGTTNTLALADAFRLLDLTK